MVAKARVFFIFRFTDHPDPIFWKLKKKKKRFFSILFFHFPLTHASTVLEFSFVFSTAAGLVKLPPVTAPGEILPL